MENMKEQIKELQRLNTRKRELEKQMGPHVEKAMRRFAKAYYKNKHNDRPPPPDKPHADLRFSWYLEGNEICAEWEHRWRFGGVAGGHFFMDSNLLYDEAAFKAYEDKATAERGSYDRRVADEKTQRELKQLAELEAKHRK